ARIVVQDVPYDPWALADFFSKDQLERGSERIVRRQLSLHWGAGTKPRISCHAVAASQPERTDSLQGWKQAALMSLPSKRLQAISNRLQQQPLRQAGNNLRLRHFQ